MILGTCLRASRLIKRHYSTRPTVVVQGGVGQLGRDVVSRFKENNWTVVTIDGMKNDKAHYSFVLGPAGEKADSDAIVEFLKTNRKCSFDSGLTFRARRVHLCRRWVERWCHQL